MSDVNPEALAEKAMRVLNEGDPREARKLLLEATQLAPERPDLMNALGIVHLQLGEPEIGRQLIVEAIGLAERAGFEEPEKRDQLRMMVESFQLGLAAASEDLDEPAEAKHAYDQILGSNPGHPRARAGRAHLYLAWGQVEAGLAELRAYIQEDRDENTFIDGASAMANAVDQFRKDDIHPHEILVAHRGSYVDFFDHHAREQQAKGWIAEAARMKRAPDGKIVPMLADGARPYAAVRVDLVNPATSEVGQIGDQPMVVALANYQALARAPVVFDTPGHPFPVGISTQTPWDQLPIAVLFAGSDAAGSALDALDAVIGDWYMRGWDGEFGSKDGHRLHYISDPEPRRGGRGVVYNVDMGRSRLDAIDDLMRRLEVLHGQHPIAKVVIGRGHLP